MKIIEGNYYETLTGRIGKAYAVSEKKTEQGVVDLFFEGPGGLYAVGIFLPPSGLFKIETLKESINP